MVIVYAGSCSKTFSSGNYGVGYIRSSKIPDKKEVIPIPERTKESDYISSRTSHIPSRVLNHPRVMEFYAKYGGRRVYESLLNKQLGRTA